MGKSKQQRLRECEGANRIIREAAETINLLANAPRSAPSTAKSLKVNQKTELSTFTNR